MVNRYETVLKLYLNGQVTVQVLNLMIKIVLVLVDEDNHMKCLHILTL